MHTKENKGCLRLNEFSHLSLIMKAIKYIIGHCRHVLTAFHLCCKPINCGMITSIRMRPDVLSGRSFIHRIRQRKCVQHHQRCFGSIQYIDKKYVCVLTRFKFSIFAFLIPEIRFIMDKPSWAIQIVPYAHNSIK